MPNPLPRQSRTGQGRVAPAGLGLEAAELVWRLREGFLPAGGDSAESPAEIRAAPGKA
jgi:hypothetical protein